MSNYRCKQHPTLGVLVFTDGSVMVPANPPAKAHLTKGSKNSEGYLSVRISRKPYKVHRLVVETFIGEIPAGMQVDHINRNRRDNRLENLRIVTPSANSKNSEAYDRVEKSLGVHACDDRRAYDREFKKHNPESVERHRMQCREYRSRKNNERR